MRPSHRAGVSILVAALAIGLGDVPQDAWAQEASPSVILDVEGSLEDGDSLIPMDNSLYDEHTFEGQADQQVTITLASTEFDPYLIVFSPGGELLGQADDISESDLTAQLVITLPNDGLYTILANAFDDTGRGQYTLTVTPGGSSSPEGTPQPDPPAEVDAYVGETFVGGIPGEAAPLPGRPTHLGGWMIVPPGMQNPDELRYGVNNLLMGDNLVMLFSETIGHESDGRAIWTVLDAVSVPTDNLMLSETLQGEYIPWTMCSLDGTADPEVLAIVRLEDEEFFSDIRQAWRANRETGALEEIPVAGIRCANPGWGV